MFRFRTTSSIRSVLAAFCVAAIMAGFLAGSSQKIEQSDSVVSVAKIPDQRVFDFAVRQSITNQFSDVVVSNQTSLCPPQAAFFQLPGQYTPALANRGVISNQHSLFYLRVALKA